MTRARVGLAAVIVTALMPAAFVFVDVTSNPALFRGRDDPLSVFERRVAPLRDAVRDALDQPLVVADGVTSATRIPPQLRVRRDFGNGLLLLEAVPP